MNEYDDILGNTNKSQNNNYKNNYSSGNSWQEKQNKQRKEAYDTMEKMAIAIKDNSSLFKQYLDIQSKFEKHSVGNCLLILDQAPNAAQFKDKKSWNDKGISLISNYKKIVILEPSRSKTTDKVYYNPKEVIDISQTNAPKQENIINYDDRELLQAFLNNCGVERKAVDILPISQTKGAEYNKEEKVLYLCRGMEREQLFQTLSQELANIEMQDIEDGGLKSFKSYCISYMLCKRYGIDVSNFDFSRLPHELTNKSSGKDVRAELEYMRIDFEKINLRVASFFENSAKEKKPKTQER